MKLICTFAAVTHIHIAMSKHLYAIICLLGILHLSSSASEVVFDFTPVDFESNNTEWSNGALSTSEQRKNITSDNGESYIFNVYRVGWYKKVPASCYLGFPKQQGGYIILPSFEKPITSIELVWGNTEKSKFDLTAHLRNEILYTFTFNTDRKSCVYTPEKPLEANKRFCIKATGFTNSSPNWGIEKIIITFEDNNDPGIQQASAPRILLNGHNIENGCIVEPGAALSFDCETKDAIIHYVIEKDGSAHMESDYAGTPTIINNPGEYAVTAYSVKNGLSPSEKTCGKFFVQNADKKDADISYNTQEVSVCIENAESFKGPVLNNPNNLAPIKYHSSAPTVASVDNNGKVSIITTGKATISATYQGNSTFRPGEASYSLTVTRAEIPKVSCPIATIDGESIINGQTIYTGKTIKLTCETPEASIEYAISIDDKPALSGTYGSPLSITETGKYQITAKASKQGFADSDTYQAYFNVVKNPTPGPVDEGEFHFDFAHNDYGMTRHSNTDSGYNDTMTIIKNNCEPELKAIITNKLDTDYPDSKNRLLNDGLHFYAGLYDPVLTAPAGCSLRRIELQGGITDTPIINDDYSYGIWSGDTGSVLFKINNDSDKALTGILVQYALFPTEAPTAFSNNVLLADGATTNNGEVRFETQEGASVYCCFEPVKNEIEQAAASQDVIVKDGRSFIRMSTSAYTATRDGMLYYFARRNGLDSNTKTIQFDQLSGITTIETDSGTRYYNLQGIPVDTPSQGVYIVVKGDKYEKVRF